MDDSNSEPPMPDWAPPAGPWCLKRWLPLPSNAPPTYDLCLLPIAHEGDCRTIHFGFRNHDNAKFLGVAVVCTSESSD